MSRTLEAILSRSDADDDLSVPPEGRGGGVGTKTLLGIGVSGLPLPPRAAPATDKGEQTFSVEDVFDDEGTAVSSVNTGGKTKGKAGRKTGSKKRKGGGDRVGDLLDEVAEALNVQAASQDSTVGALPGKPVPQARPIRPDRLVAKDGELEFEDPDDGPTTLNVQGDFEGEDVDVGADDDDEAVVLGPARLPAARPIPAPPARPAVLAAATETKSATPFSGLPTATLPLFPAPASGRSRLPTPAPGQAIGMPPPGRAGLPGGTPVNGVPETHGDSSRRTSSGRTAGARDKSNGHHASAVVMESLTSAMESASVVLKKDVKFRVASLAGLVAGTFLFGLLIGRVVMGNGKKTVAEASEVAGSAASGKSAAAPAVPSAPVEAPAVQPAPAAPPAVAAVAPAAAPPTQVAEIAPSAVAPAPGDEASPATAHKRRARRINPVPADDGLPKPPAAKPVVAAKPAKAAPQPSPSKAAPKKKSTWHDPFAD